MVPDHNGDQTPLQRHHAVVLVAILIVTIAALFLMGQPWWCESGDLAPWSGDVNSSHNSQHLADPYTLTHVLHGVALYGILWALLGARLGQPSRFVLAMGIEATWEIFENTPFVINRYREATISLDYFGDSIVNSLGDITACALGYAAATALPVWGSALFFVAVEVALLLWIRDSLLLNIIMLTWPIEALRDWQMGGSPDPTIPR